MCLEKWVTANPQKGRQLNQKLKFSKFFVRASLITKNEKYKKYKYKHFYMYTLLKHLVEYSNICFSVLPVWRRAGLSLYVILIFLWKAVTVSSHDGQQSYPLRRIA